MGHTPTAHIAVFETLADWEPGHLLAELRTGRFTGAPFEVVTVADATAPVTTMGGVRIVPDMALDELDPSTSDLLILPGSQHWEEGGHEPLAVAAARFLEAGTPVAAICGATYGLAAAGLLDDRRHTSAAAEYLATSGYAGGELYVDERAVADRGLVTAGPDSPVQFASATLGLLGLMAAELCDTYESVFAEGDARAYPTLMEAAA